MRSPHGKTSISTSTGPLSSTLSWVTARSDQPSSLRRRFRALPILTEQSWASAWFSEATFTAAAGFSRMDFIREAQFGRVQFGAGADFTRTKFRQDAWFPDSVFNGVANFKGTEFNSVAEFGKATFLAAVYFDKAFVPADAWFEGVTISGSGASSSTLPVGWQMVTDPGVPVVRVVKTRLSGLT